MSSVYDGLRAGPFIPQGPLGSLRLRAGVAAYDAVRRLQPNDNTLRGLGTIALAGPPGPAGSSFESYPASGAMSGHRMVALVRGQAVYASTAEPLHIGAVVGITTGANNAGSPVTVQRSGLITESSWTWAPDLPVYVSGQGFLSQVPPVSGWVRIIGVAQSPTSLLVALREPIVLQES